MDTHNAVSTRLFDLLGLLTHTDKQTISAEQIEEVTELYLLLGALLQSTFVLKVTIQ